MRTISQRQSFGFGTLIACMTGLVSFLANLVTIFSEVKFPIISFGSVSIDIPAISVGTSGVLTNSSFAFATMIYSSVALALFSKAISDRHYYYTLSCLPSILIVLWAAKFYSHRSLIIYPCLIFGTIWMAIFIKKIGYSMSLGKIILPVLMWPTIALILIHVRGSSDMWAWIFSSIMLIIQFVIIKMDDW